MNNRLINTKVAGGGGGCTDIVDDYDPFGGNGVALYQLNGDATDVSGNYNGAWSGTETYSTGVFGQASVFNGSSYIQASAGYPSTLGDITVSGWFNFSNTNNGWVGDNSGSLFSLGQSTTNVAGNNLCIRLAENSTTFNLQSFNNDSSITMNTASPSIGTWFHIALTYEISTNKFKVYLNGAYQGESAALTYNFQTTAFRIGSGVQGGGTFHFQGLSDQVRIFNEALTPLEVEALYTEELCICDGTVDTLDILGDGSCIATYQLDGNANDLSGNYSGTPTNVSYGVGEFDLAGVFNGTSSYITTPFTYNNIVNLNDKTQDFSFALWMYQSSLPSAGTKNVFAINEAAPSYQYIGLVVNGSNINFVSYPGGAAGDGATTTTDLNVWTHIVCVRESSTLKIYKNGSLAQSTPMVYANMSLDSTLRWVFGSRRDGANDNYFNGSIDQVRIFNKALSAGEVTTLYNETACTIPSEPPFTGGDFNGLEYQLVTNPTTGRTWLDRNLGATRVATSQNDSAAFGHYYQWGRLADGHQIPTSNVITSISSTDNPHSDSFINASVAPKDWRSPQNSALWQGVNGRNNPCPPGFRLPTEAELEEEAQSWGSQNSAGAFASVLKLATGNGVRINTGSFSDTGAGYLWTSDTDGVNAKYYYYAGGGDFFGSIYRGLGTCIRPIKDE